MCTLNLAQSFFLLDLLSEILEWLPESEHDEVKLKWPPIKLPVAEEDT